MEAECCPDPRLPGPLPRAPPFALATPSHLIPSATIPSPRLCSHPEPEGEVDRKQEEMLGQPQCPGQSVPSSGRISGPEWPETLGWDTSPRKSGGGEQDRGPLLHLAPTAGHQLLWEPTAAEHSLRVCS